MTPSPRLRRVAIVISALLSVGSCLFWALASYASAFGSASGQGKNTDWQMLLSMAAFGLTVVFAFVTNGMPPKKAIAVSLSPIALLIIGLALGAAYEGRRFEVARDGRIAKVRAIVEPLSRDFVCPRDEAYNRDIVVTHDRERRVLVKVEWNLGWGDVVADPVGRVVDDTLEWFTTDEDSRDSHMPSLQGCVDASGRTVEEVYRLVRPSQVSREADYGLQRFELR